MAVDREAFQGVSNIIRFNWPFYVIAATTIITLFLIGHFFDALRIFAFAAGMIAMLTIIVSLAVSFYVYDLSGLYELAWLNDIEDKKLLNVNAGFDETSEIIRDRFPNCDLTICDFFDAENHTEPSINRARKAYPLDENVISVAADDMPFPDGTFDCALAILSAHEIRNTEERVALFRELRRIIKPDGVIFVTEHIRDVNNFLAYTIGAFHFHSRPEWLRTFENAGLAVIKETKTTPFITTFMLKEK